MLVVDRHPFMVSMNKIGTEAMSALDSVKHRAAELLNKLFTALTDLYNALQSLLSKPETSLPSMVESVAVKELIESTPTIETTPAPVQPKAQPKKNPLVNVFTAMALVPILSKLPPEAGVIITQLITHATIKNINWQNETRTGHLEVGLKDGIEGKVSITLPEENPSQEATGKPAEVHPFILKTLTEKKVDLSLIAVILKSLPTSVATFQWNGSTNNLVAVVDLPNAVKLTFDLNIPPSKVGELFPTLFGMMPEKAQEMIPMISPLLGQNFHLIWDGTTSSAKVRFEKPQELDLNGVQLKQVGFLSKLIKWATGGVKVSLPQHAQININLKTLQIDFGPGVEFKISKGILSKKIDINKIAFSPDKKCVDIDIKCFGKKKIHVDLTTSNVDKVNFNFHPKEVKKK